MAGRGGHNELSGRARLAAQVRTVHGGLHFGGSSMLGVTLMVAVVGLVLVVVIRPPELPGEVGAGVARAVVVEPAWDVVELPKGSKPAVVAMKVAEELLRRAWPRGAWLRDARSSRISNGLWLRVDVVLPDGACAGVVEVMVIDCGDVYSAFVVTAMR